MCHSSSHDLSRQLDEIIRDTTPPAYGEEHLAALTAGERTVWAETRETFFRAGANRSSLEAIEKAAFILVLDEDEFEIGTVSERAVRGSPSDSINDIGQGNSIDATILRSIQEVLEGANNDSTNMVTHRYISVA
jgi:hypothetical protein